MGLHVFHVFINGMPNRIPIPLEEGYVHREISLCELIPFADSEGELAEELTTDFLREATERGDLCVASFFGKELVGFDFASTRRLPATPQLDQIIPPGFLYSYKSWTHPGHRRKKLGLGRIEIQRTQELNYIYAIETHNYPSLLRSYRQPLERRIRMGYAGWIEIRGRQYPFASRRAKWIGFGLARKGEWYDRRIVEG
jgi:hypothetical protein